MKSLAELENVKKRMTSDMAIRKDIPAVRVEICMGECGLQAVAREIMLAFLDEIHINKLEHTAVILKNCMGRCEEEPIAQISIPGEKTVTYSRLTPDMARKVVINHLINKKPIEEYMMRE